MAYQINYENIRLGELLDLRETFGWTTSVKVHYFNKKGVLIGRKYEFVAYNRLYRRHFHNPIFAKNVNWVLKLYFRIREYLIRLSYKDQKT